MFNTSTFNRLVLACMFVLPWQTVYVFHIFTIADGLSAFAVTGVYVSQVMILLMAIYGFMLLPVSKRIMAGKRFGVMALFFAVFTAISSAPFITLSLLWHIGVSALLAFSVLHQETNREMVLRAFVLGLIAPSIIGFVQSLLGTFPASTVFGIAARDAEVLGESVIQLSNGTRFLRAYGTFPHPNIFGGYLVIGLLALMEWWKKSKSKQEKIALIVIAGILCSALLLTFSRSAWLALALAFSLLALKHVFKHIPFVKLASVFTAVALTAVLVLTYVSGASSWRPMSDGDFEARSVSERVMQYQEFLPVIAPTFLTGSGIGTYPWAVEKVFPERAWFMYQPIHNVWFLLFAELGVILCGILLIMLARRTVRVNQYSPFFILAISTLVSISFFDHYLVTLWPGIALTACVFAFIRGFTSVDKSE